ncbi:MAG TPA: beta-propeller fold lactonase family protein [Polyangia bacterium]|jgi:6-phosphogluconolactonase (cycloisomerase 2 family)
MRENIDNSRSGRSTITAPARGAASSARPPRGGPGRVLLALLVGLPALAAAGCGEPGGDAALDGVSSLSSAETAAATAAKKSPAPVGAVYVGSNKYSGNEIVSFLRFPDGSLKAGPRVLTGGLGSGPGQLIPNDPLGAQSSLITDQKTQLMFVVNAGSNEVSSFTFDKNGVTLADRQSSKGVYPVSVTFNKGTLYVLNAASNSITGFTVDKKGKLNRTQTCQLPALPSLENGFPATATQSAQPVFSQTAGQVGFSPDGKKLLVVSKEGPLLDGFPFSPTSGNGRIHVFGVDGQGNLSDCKHPTTLALPLNPDGKGKTPFSFAWADDGTLLVTEVFGVGTSPTKPGSAVTSYDLRNDGSLTPITQSVGNGQVAVCWIVVGGRYVYTANFLSDSLSLYDDKKALTLLGGQAGLLAAGSQPSDMVLTSDGNFIYELASGASAIASFAVTAKTGALGPLAAAADGQNWTGYAGIATVDY